ncbi:MAG: aminopeptidase P family protein [Chloroflexi bacterium]|nr:aminopeptidase P family protein [Chloroflexota bacterium]
MKENLDALMLDDHIDAILVTGAAQHNPHLVYLTGTAHLTQCDMIKLRGENGVIFFNPMEREEAAKTGLSPRSYPNYMELLKLAGGDRLQATALRYQRMFESLGLRSGRVAVYGMAEVGRYHAIFKALEQVCPQIELVGYPDEDVLGRAMMTKGPDEIARIRRMGQVTTQVVAQTADFLTGHAVRDGILIRPDGEPLTIGDVKRKIDLWLVERGAENPESTIFAIGRDAAIPHSGGTPTDFLRLGQTIVFDIFPCEAGGGFFYDFTRTWCLGFASDEAYALYEQVLGVYRQVVAEIQVSEPFKKYQKLTCERFEELGHPTVLSQPGTEAGYVHSLGHGLGLQVHERPFSGTTAGDADDLNPGVVVTIEPGLYYPERGLGVRLEDTYWMTPQGAFELLADYPMDLVLPMKSG